jgi:ribonuclease HI
LEKYSTSSSHKKAVLSFDLVNNNIKYRKSNTLELPIEVHTLESLARKEINYTIYPNIENEYVAYVDIEDHGIQILKEYIRSYDYLQQLLEEYKANVLNYHHQALCFYTDGSMGKTKDQTIKMGAAWIQTVGPNPGRYFTAGVDNWPSVPRAELVAIILVTLVVPKGCILEIKTDSAVCINTYKKISKLYFKNSITKWMKIHNWQLWMRLQDLIIRKEITLQLTKVKAHSNDKWNEKVDKLAKEAREEPELIWEDQQQPIALTTTSWNGIPIDTPLRTFIKEVHKREILVKWASQNRIQQKWQKEISNQAEVEWKEFWEQCRPKGSLYTSMKQMKEKSFKVKMMHNELPTLDNMAKRSPDLYMGYTKCIFCKDKEETLDHLLMCKSLKTIRKEIWNTVENKTTNNWIFKYQEKDSNTSLEQFKLLLKRWLQEYFTTGEEIIKICLGLISKKEIQNWEKALAIAGVKSSKAKLIRFKFTNMICKQLRKKVWNVRCEEIQQWKKEIGIPSLREIKSCKKRQLTSSRKKRRIQKLKGKNIINQQELATNLLIEEEERSIKLKTIVWEWLKEGKKWLGI